MDLLYFPIVQTILEEAVVVLVLLVIQEIIQNQHPQEETVVLVEQMFMYMDQPIQ